jgi:cytochrome c oxidase subunit II
VPELGTKLARRKWGGHLLGWSLKPAWLLRPRVSGYIACLFLMGVLLGALTLAQDANSAQTPPNAFGLQVDPHQSALEPVAPVAKAQISLLYYTLWLSLIVIVGVGGALIYAMVRFRKRAGDDSIPEQSHGNPALEVGLILAATILTVAVAIPAMRVHFKYDTHIEGTNDDVIVNVTGYQWWWKFEYPQYGITTANELYLPKDKRIIVNLKSADVLHSFWMPRLVGKMDLIPNQDNSFWFTTEGAPAMVYRGQCAELCLGAHAYMRFRIIVDEQANFDKWVADFQKAEQVNADTGLTLQPQLVQANPDIEQGKALFKQKGCGACHAIGGYSVGQTDKPNLTHYGLRTSIAAGVLEMSEDNLVQWIAHPDQVKPGNYMPNLWVDGSDAIETEPRLIAKYLMSLGRENATISSTTEPVLEFQPITSQLPSTSLGGSNGN